jgi:hypothetical protein
MFAAKTSLSLLAIAACGFICAGSGAPNAAPTATSPIATLPRSTLLSSGPVVPSTAVLQSAAEKRLLAQIRRDLDDSEARVQLSSLRFVRVSNRSLEGRGEGTLLFDAKGTIPIQVVVTYDLPEQKMERADYLVAAGAESLNDELLGKSLRDNISDSIGSRLVLEFSQQPVDFSLEEITHLASGRNRLMISGNGITRFPGEGAAYTRFVATADRFSGRLISISYELLQQVEAPDGTPIAMK